MGCPTANFAPYVYAVAGLVTVRQVFCAMLRTFGTHYSALLLHVKLYYANSLFYLMIGESVAWSAATFNFNAETFAVFFGD